MILKTIFPDVATQEAIIEDYKSVKGDNDIITKSWISVGTKTGFLYNKSLAVSYFSLRLSEDVTEVFVCDPPVISTNLSRYTINGVTYEAESPIDVGNIGEIFVIGLKVLK